MKQQLFFIWNISVAIAIFTLSGTFVSTRIANASNETHEIQEYTQEATEETTKDEPKEPEEPEETEEERAEREERERLAREEAERQAEVARRAEAERRDAAERAHREWISIPAGQRLVNAARPMLTDEASAYHFALRGPQPRAQVNGNYRHARRVIGAIGSYEDCGSFMATVIRFSGVDPFFPRLTTGVMLNHLINSPRWTDVPNTGSSATLEPGDVFSVVGHIFMYLGGGQAAHARLEWALPYAFNIYKPFWRHPHWEAHYPAGSPEWEHFSRHYINTHPSLAIHYRRQSGGQFKNGIWATSRGTYRIFRPRYI